MSQGKILASSHDGYLHHPGLNRSAGTRAWVDFWGTLAAGTPYNTIKIREGFPAPGRSTVLAVAQRRQCW